MRSESAMENGRDPNEAHETPFTDSSSDTQSDLDYASNCNICKEYGLAEIPHPGYPPLWLRGGKGKGRLVQLQRWLAYRFESHKGHIVVVILTFMSLCLIMTDLALFSFYPYEQARPPAVKNAGRALAWISVGIMAIFTSEQVLKFLVFVPKYFLTFWHALDLIIIVSSLVLGILLRGPARETVALLVCFRLWRLITVMRSIVQGLRIQNIEISHKHHKVQAKLERQIEVLKSYGGSAGDLRGEEPVRHRHIEVEAFEHRNDVSWCV